MEHKMALNVLLRLLEKDSLTEEEKEAVQTAIGVLSWTSLADSRLKAMARKKKLAQEKFTNPKNPSKIG